MARQTKKTEDTSLQVENVEVENENDYSPENDPIYALRMDDKITIKNLASWTVGFRKIDSVGEVTIQAGGTARLSRGEVVAQAENGNKLIAGLDGMGSHATIQINDEATKRYLGWTNQLIISKALVKEIFNEKDEDVYKQRMSDLTQTRCEREYIKQVINKEGLENTIPYGRIKYALDLCKMRF